MFRSCGSEDEFYLPWSLGPHHQLHRQTSLVERGSVTSDHQVGVDISVDILSTLSIYLQRQGSRVSVSSDPSSVEADSTYDQPKTVLKVTSSPLKRRTQQVRLHTQG